MASKKIGEIARNEDGRAALTQSQKAALYRQYRSMLARSARMNSIRYGLEFEELEASANLIFARTCEDWNPDRAGICTRLYANLRRLDGVAATMHARSEREPLACDITLRASSEEEGEHTVMDTAPASDPGPIRDLEIVNYIHTQLRGDALLLAQMILDKAMDPPPVRGGTNRQSIRLSAWTCYVRRTRDLGWDVQRTANAYNVLSGAMQNYILGFDTLDQDEVV